MDKKNQMRLVLLVGVVIGVIYGWICLPMFHNVAVGRCYVFLWLICCYGLIRFKKWAMIFSNLLYGIIFCYEAFVVLFGMSFTWGSPTVMQKLENTFIHNWQTTLFIVSTLLWFFLFSKKSVRSMFG